MSWHFWSPALQQCSQQVSRLQQALLPMFLHDEVQWSQHEGQVTMCAVSEEEQHDEKPAEDFKGLDAAEKLGVGTATPPISETLI